MNLPRSPLRAKGSMRRVLDYGLILNDPVVNDLYSKSHVAGGAALADLGEADDGFGERTHTWFCLWPFSSRFAVRAARYDMSGQAVGIDRSSFSVPGTFRNEE
jgi:hypothetical protein